MAVIGQMSYEQAERVAAGGGRGLQKQLQGDPRTMGATCHGGNSRLSHNGLLGGTEARPTAAATGPAGFSNRFQALFSYKAANRQGSWVVT